MRKQCPKAASERQEMGSQDRVKSPWAEVQLKLPEVAFQYQDLCPKEVFSPSQKWGWVGLPTRNLESIGDPATEGCLFLALLICPYWISNWYVASSPLEGCSGCFLLGPFRAVLHVSLSSRRLTFKGCILVSFWSLWRSPLEREKSA